MMATLAIRFAAARVSIFCCCSDMVCSPRQKDFLRPGQRASRIVAIRPYVEGIKQLDHSIEKTLSRVCDRNFLSLGLIVRTLNRGSCMPQEVVGNYFGVREFTQRLTPSFISLDLRRGWKAAPFQTSPKRRCGRYERLRRNLWLCRRLRCEDAGEAFAVLKEDQNPQHASDQGARDAGGCHRQMERKDVVEFRCKHCQRKWHEKAGE